MTFNTYRDIDIHLFFNISLSWATCRPRLAMPSYICYIVNRWNVSWKFQALKKFLKILFFIFCLFALYYQDYIRIRAEQFNLIKHFMLS